MVNNVVPLGRSLSYHVPHHPHWHRRSAHAPVFSDEIDNTPAAVALLDMRERERRHFGPSQPAPEKNREDRPVAQPGDRRYVGRAEQRLRTSISLLIE
jgi:hypothetical protein